MMKGKLSATTQTRISTAPVARLEEMDEPLPPDGSIDEETYALRLAGRIDYLERCKILSHVSNEVHLVVSDMLRTSVSSRRRTALFGVDAVTVFSAGGPLLDRLQSAADQLTHPGRGATAALEARSLLQELGVKLYTGDGRPYRSTLDGKEYDPERSEKHRLHAVIDALIPEDTDDRRRASLIEAHRHVETVMAVGARAKTQPISHDEAEVVVRAAYRVAHALCFAGGFPPREVTAP
jgi:hypothetical protein